MTLRLCVCVDGGPAGSAAQLATAKEDFLDAILILRVEVGGAWAWGGGIEGGGGGYRVQEVGTRLPAGWGAWGLAGGEV